MSRVLCFALSVLIAMPAAAGLLREGDPARGLLPVPEPDTARKSPAIVAKLTDAEREFDRVHSDSQGWALGQAYGKLGMHYQSHRLNIAAEAAYRNALKLDPDQWLWPSYFGFLLQEEGRFQESREMYAQALEMAPEQWPVRMRDARVAFEMGDLDTAESVAERVLQQRPEEAAAIALLGKVAAKRGDHARAVELLERALELQPAADLLNYDLALSLRRVGRAEEARERMAARGTRGISFDDIHLASMQNRSRLPSFYLEVAEKASAAGSLEEATILYELASEISPSNVPARIGLGRSLALLEQLEEAETHLRRAVELAPDDPLARSSLGKLLEMQELDQAAAEQYQRLVELDPDQAEGWRLLGNALMRSGRYAAAEDAYIRMLELDAELADGTLLVAMAQAGDNRCGAALDTLRPVIDTERLDPASALAFSRLIATCGVGSQQDLQQALAIAEGLHGRWPSVETAATLAMALAANGRYEAAAELSRRALFESLRTGGHAEEALVRRNLARFEDGQPSRQAFVPDSSFLSPARVRAETPGAGDRSQPEG